MPPVNGVGEPGAGEPHARFEVAGAGKGMTWPRSPGVAQPTGKPAEERPWALPSDIITSPAPDPTLALVSIGQRGHDAPGSAASQVPAPLEQTVYLDGPGRLGQGPAVRTRVLSAAAAP